MWFRLAQSGKADFLGKPFIASVLVAISTFHLPKHGPWPTDRRDFQGGTEVRLGELRASGSRGWAGRSWRWGSGCQAPPLSHPAAGGMEQHQQQVLRQPFRHHEVSYRVAPGRAAPMGQ